MERVLSLDDGDGGVVVVDRQGHTQKKGIIKFKNIQIKTVSCTCFFEGKNKIYDVIDLPPLRFKKKDEKKRS